MRCVNIDWLEVFCLEPTALGPRYYESRGFTVRLREYGTPQYRQMFTILDKKKTPLIEVRRDPYSLKSEGGIFRQGSCHLRLTNAQCYTKNPVLWLINFLRENHYQLISTSRLDICLDFVHFDCNQSPARFLRDYFANKYAKINQAKFATHGVDAWEDKLFNSCKWGSEFSKITTKIYNKSMELNRDGHDKAYIRASWLMAGLPEDKDIWRIEYSMKSECKSLVRAADVFFDDATGEVMGEHTIDISLANLLDKQDWIALFFALTDHYFDFRYVEYNRNGKPQRKDRCSRVPLFRLSALEQGYVFKRLNVKPKPGRREKMMMKYLKEIYTDRDTWGIDAENAAYSLREVFSTRYQCAMTDEDPRSILLPAEREPKVIVKHDLMTDEQFTQHLEHIEKTYSHAITDYIVKSGKYYKIREQVRQQIRNEEKHIDLPF